MLSGICCFVCIIYFQCMCNGAANEETCQMREYKKERIDDNLERNWLHTFQKDVFANEIGLETNNGGREGGTKTTKKYEKRKDKGSKEGNDEKLKFGEASPNEMVRGTNVSDERKMRKQQRFEEESWIEGCLMIANSSIKLHSLGLVPNDGQSVLNAAKGCFIEVRRCRIEIGGEMPPFCLSGSCGLFTNISLRFPLNSHFQKCPSLFSSKPFEEVHSEKCHVSVCSSHFSSFCVSSAPFLSSPSIPLISISHLIFFNVSTAPDACPSPTTAFSQTSCMISSCTFSSVCDAYDGGIVPSLNNLYASLTASNTSFVGCCRTRNVEFIGSKDAKQHPGRQNTTTNGANSFFWCEWNGSKTTGERNSYDDGASSGGAIWMHNLGNGELYVSHCSFNACCAFFGGGAVICVSIRSFKMENNLFNACIAEHSYGGGMYAVYISTCARISRCKFNKCEALECGGGIYLDNFNATGTDCIGTESGKGESSCLFDCNFSFCSVFDTHGGGMFCKAVPSSFRMSSIKFISCSAKSHGGDYYRHFSNLNNPLSECYTTNFDERRTCYEFNLDGKWDYQQTEKKWWLKDKTLYVSVNGNDEYVLCGANTTYPCLTVKKAFEMCEIQLSLAVTLMEGDHTSETTTIEIGEKKISVIGMGKEKSVIGTGALSSTSISLFSVTSGHLGLMNLKVDCNSTTSPSSPSVVVVSKGSGLLSLEDVVITTSNTEDYVISSSLFVVALSQLSMAGVEIKDMNVSKPLFSEPNLSSSSSSSSLSSSTLFLTSTTSEESLLANLTVMNVKLTEGDGVVVAKSVKSEETFVVSNITIEGCECEEGNGGGINIELASSTSKARIGTSTSHTGGITKFNKTKCSGYGGGVMLWLADNSFDFTISSVNFVDCRASLGGKDVFVNGSGMTSTAITSQLNIEYNESSFDELMGYDRNEEGMGIFPLSVYFDSFSGAAYVGIKKNGFGGYDSWFCGFEYFPCKTITKAAENRFSSSKKNIVLDSGFELGEVVSMAGSYEWEVYCGINKTNVNVKVPSGMTSSYLINVQSTSSIKNIAFQIPFLLSSATSLIGLTSSSLTLTDCSVAHISESTSSVAFGYSIVNVQSGSLKMERFVIEEGLTFNDHSAIELCEGMTSVICSGCNISGVVKNEGDGGWMKGTAETSGTLTVDGCNVNGCSCVGGNGGGIHVGLKGNGKVVVSGTSVIDGNKAENNGGNGGRGGGMFVMMEGGGCGLTIGENVKFSKVKENMASYGKDVFVHCGSGVFLNSKVNTNSFAFFDTSVIPSDMLRLSGSENGNENGVIPLFVYFHSLVTKMFVDGSGGNGMDHNRCGFEGFGCLTVDYCANSRLNESSKEIEVVSSSLINAEIEFSLFDVSISGRETSLEEEKIQVNVSDEGSATQDWLVGCSSSLIISGLSFVVKGQFDSRRSAFIHSTSTLSLTNCSVSFESGALTDGKIEYNVINIEGGELIMNGFVIEGSVTTNGKSSISMTNGVKLEMNNSRMSGVEVTCGIGGGCLNVGMNEEGGSVCIEESSLSSTCSGGNGMKGGGMMISMGNGGSLEMKKVKFDGCEVPLEDNEEGGKGIGGGMFVELPNQMGSFVLEGMTFEGCNAWKGKNVFVSGWDLSEVVSKDHFKWEMSSEELGSLDELCGWERKTTGDEGYVIPLVVYLWSNWSGNGFVSKENGGDFSGCGYSEAPCSSIEHLISLRYEPLGEGESHINIVGTGALNRGISFPSPPSLTETPIVTIEGEKKGTVLKVREMDGNGESESMVVSNVHLSFKNISFTMPNELGRHSSFILSSSSSAMLSVVSCSIDCEEERREMKYCVVRVDGGSVAIEDLTLSELSVAKGFVEFGAEVEVISVVNVSILNTTISGGSLIALTEGSHNFQFTKREERNANTVARVNESTFTNISCGENGACVVSADSFGVGVECVMEGCVLTKCVSERSEEGGGVKMCLKSGESELKVRGCSFVMCMCSTMNGRGGGLMIDALDPKAELVEKETPALGVRLENIRFVMNEAFVGKDVFIKCYSIARQVNETLFVLDFSQDALKSNNSICGRDDVDKVDVDLIPLITFFHSPQVFVSVNGSDSRQCGAQDKPCQSICCGVRHIERSVANMILIDGECLIGGVCEIGDLNVKSLKSAQATIHLNAMIEEDEMNGGSVIVFVDECVVERCGFVFGEMFGWDGESIVKEKDGRLEISECLFSSATMDLVMKSRIVGVESGELKMTETTFDGIHTTAPLLSFTKEGKVLMSEIRVWDVMSECGLICVGGKVDMEMKEVNFENNSVCGNESVMKMEGAEKRMSVLNCSFAKCQGTNERGGMVEIRECVDVQIGSCLFDGEEGDERKGKQANEVKGSDEEICRWDGSLMDISNSSVLMKDTAIANSPEGGITMSGGSVLIEAGNFSNNCPSIEGYPSLRRNIICSDSGILNVVSVKGGDGVLPNTSLWMLNDGCSFEGIVSERDSSFFIPILESVEAIEEANRMKLTFKGMLLIPCNLSFSVVKRKGEEKEIEKHDFDSNGFLSEREVEGSVGKYILSSCGNEIEVSVHILFGNTESPSSTNSFILKNASETKQKDDEKIVEGGKEGKSYWLLIVIIMSVILVIVLVVSIILAVRWRKAKNENKDLREIVNDNIRKDPKAFEMVTMEMSPEEQWRRAEKEAEKKNEERIKKRVNEKSLGHSDSSEHLLSESDSTEYILGKDSDKIPDWALEKEEEEEIRKRSPSPSISSTSTTDSDSTFVRGEDLCPTTSSMSNLVDAMACSSPHEKLIVDLRDSLFMLLHGRNEKKEMAIGTLQEREMTAAQILFWVANLALHSFDEMENGLSSLSNLSPHIILFSEHMVICIVLHSDLLLSDDSDSDLSSISSSTIVTSVSDNDDDDDDSLPSSAFEDENDFKKECLRWKAPELLINKKMGATKESVVFSIGMMLWECLTLQIPFGEFEAEVAGQKIVNGERPHLSAVGESSFCEVMKAYLWQEAKDRAELESVRRECVSHFPAGKLIMTMSDGIFDRNKRIVVRSDVESGGETLEEEQTEKKDL